MTQIEKLGYLAWIENAGVTFHVGNVQISANEVQGYSEDPALFMASKAGLTRQEWTRYLGRVQIRCNAMNAHKHRCGNNVKGTCGNGLSATLEDFIRLKDGYCYFHGG